MKTDAPFSAVWDIIRCWVQDHPVKGHDADSYGKQFSVTTWMMVVTITMIMITIIILTMTMMMRVTILSTTICVDKLSLIITNKDGNSITIMMLI